MKWLRRNLAAILVIVLAIPALAFVLVGVPLIDRPAPTIVSVKEGETIKAGGYSFTVTASQEFPGTGTGPGTNSIPTGSSLIGVLVDAEPIVGPVPDDNYCDVELTSRAGGTDRTWRPISSPSDFAYEVGDDRTTICLLDDAEKFELEQVFLVPASAYEGATLDMVVGATTYRFELPRE
ncbi:MAG: hypothetical protein JWR04_2843 [Rhodoglobus sp.]|nr:hypothetical protein [Rhodoglobus sp.]